MTDKVKLTHQEKIIVKAFLSQILQDPIMHETAIHEVKQNHCELRMKYKGKYYQRIAEEISLIRLPGYKLVEILEREF